MTTAVKLFAHRGLVAAPVVTKTQDARDTVFVLDQPYLAAEAISAGGAALSSSAATAPAKTSLLRIEVADAGAVRIEFNPPGRNVAATANSPIWTGKDVAMFGENWTISVIEA